MDLLLHNLRTGGTRHDDWSVAREAADEIERLREALRIASAAVGAILAGTDMTLHLPAGEKWPQGWPRGELLSVTERGKNYSFNPLKVLAFMQRLGKLSNGQALNDQDNRPERR